MNSELNLSPVSSLSSSRTDVLRWFGQQILQLVAAVKEWHARDVRRAQLAQLPTWIKRDLGLSDADVWRELGKYPWQP